MGKYLRKKIDEEFCKIDKVKITELSEKQKAIECIKAISRIEGYTMSYEGLKRTPLLYDNLDYLMQYFQQLLLELDK